MKIFLVFFFITGLLSGVLSYPHESVDVELHGSKNIAQLNNVTKLEASKGFTVTVKKYALPPTAVQPKPIRVITTTTITSDPAKHTRVSTSTFSNNTPKLVKPGVLPATTTTITFGSKSHRTSTRLVTQSPTRTSLLTSPTTTNLRTWYSGTPSEFLTTPPWTTPSAAPCTNGPQPSYTSTVTFDDVPVTWWYGLLPTPHAGMQFKNTVVMDSRIVDLDWADMSISKPKFAVHPGFQSNNASMRGSFEDSGFIALANGASFDIVSVWVQCDWPCELHVYEMGFSSTERELLTNKSVEPESQNGRLTLPGGVATDGMKFVNFEKTYGRGAGKKLRWMRFWARDLRDDPKWWFSSTGEVAVGFDDLVIRKRVTGPACAEPNPDWDYSQSYDVESKK
ncbi:hypothetical protein BDZ91DRAFT_317265 [Kalaharituber pfeilii]|nr:hypothetical protein BDZ91DRAFT_317265 [Kalaharituber pfeilii]